MAWTKYGRHKEALETAFPDEWRDLLVSSLVHWTMLDDDEQADLEDLIRLFLADKKWDPADGFELTEHMQVLIAAMACLLLLGLDYDRYENVKWIVVQPSTFTLVGPRHVGSGVHADGPLPLLGQAHFDGPVVISWDEAHQNARHPERGHNVVYHEFAHKLDMDNGLVDGTPLLQDEDEIQRWIEVCTKWYDAVRRGESGVLLDPYAGVNPGEFFAVATETFFDRPVELREMHPDLYEVLAGFYRQDPAERQTRMWAQRS